MMKTVKSKFDVTVETHLTRYIANRNKRTGQTWRVVKRYTTERAWSEWDRAIIMNERDERVRIYHYGSCWRAS